MNEHKNTCILASSAVICNMRLVRGVELGRQAFDG